MPIGFGDWLGGLLEVMILAQLVGDSRQHALHCQADWSLGIRDHCQDWDRQRLLDLAEQLSKIGLASTVEAAGKQHFPREAIAQNPQDILILGGSQPVKCQDDMALLRETLFKVGVIGKAQGEQFLVAFQEMSDGARSDGNVLVLQCLVDLRDRAVLAVAQGADEGNDIQTELAMRQCPSTLFLGTVGMMVARTGRVGAVQDSQGQAADILNRGDCALGLVEVP
jgi:hypothetical protein